MLEFEPQRVGAPPVLRMLALVVLVLALVAGGAVVLAGGPAGSGAGAGAGANGAEAGANPASDASQAPGATNAPDASGKPGRDGDGHGPFGRGDFPGPGFMFHGRSGPGGIDGLGDGRFAITITAIEGNQLSLKTDDGWSRTIDASTATITKGTETITVGGLAVGDAIRFAQTRNDDGSYTVTDIRVVLPHVGGKVTAVSGDTITVTALDGSTGTIHVAVGTTYHSPGVDQAGLSDVKVGGIAFAQGTLREDGSLDATEVWALGEMLRDRSWDLPHRPDGAWPGRPDASPDASPEGTTTSG
ncbi:MAG: hypothetical protein QOH61_2052 [Chloroflexota bacterium]|jgi:hypothetical protein|nr:hypothetical protein [Chloroflexota bacterium]